MEELRKRYDLKYQYVGKDSEQSFHLIIHLLFYRTETSLEVQSVKLVESPAPSSDKP